MYVSHQKKDMYMKHILKYSAIMLILIFIFPIMFSSKNIAKGDIITEKNTYQYTINSINDSFISLAESEKLMFPVNGIITSHFGDIDERNSHHKGMDIAVNTGTNVLSAASGIVEEAAYSQSYGWYVKIRHYGGYETLYAHNSSVCVEKGDYIKKGETIALSGSTGDSTGPHVHFEVIKNKNYIDPETVCLKINQN